MLLTKKQLSVIRLALGSIGYREVDDGKWIKPVGFHAFSFCESNGMWENWFAHYTTGEVRLWDSKSLPESIARYPDMNLLVWLKETEAWSPIDKPGIAIGTFHLSYIDI